MRLKSENNQDPEINITSLIDVVFLLLIFFMVSTTFERQAALRIDLPEASVAAVQPEEVRRLELIIDPEGRMYLDDRQLLDNRPETIEAAFIEAAICHGCGSCASECPAQAIQIRHSTDIQTLEKINALLIQVEKG